MLATLRFTYHDVPCELVVPSPTDHIATLVTQTGTFYETDLLERLVARLGHVDGIIDVGAFCGNHTLFFRRFLGDQVLALEPNPVAYDALLDTIAANGLTYVTAVPVAMGDTDGTVRSQPREAGNLASNTVTETPPGTGVRLTTLDTLVAEVWPTVRIGLLKIDVEGAEASVLRGAVNTIARHRPWLCIELATPQALREVRGWLSARGYLIAERFGFTPTYLIQPAPRWLASLGNLGWQLLARTGQLRFLTHWYYGRLLRVLARPRS